MVCRDRGRLRGWEGAWCLSCWTGHTMLSLQDVGAAQSCLSLSRQLPGRQGITSPSCSLLKDDPLQITIILDFFVISVIIRSMNKDEQLVYADHIGRFYTRRYGFPPMAGRLLGYLTVCVPEKQSIGEL